MLMQGAIMKVKELSLTFNVLRNVLIKPARLKDVIKGIFQGESFKGAYWLARLPKKWVLFKPGYFQ